MKLLHARCADLGGLRAALQARLNDAQTQLAGVADARREREAFAGTLARAAQLLQRDDLLVELPEAGELEADVAGLTEQLAGVEEELNNYQAVFNELIERAPELLAAAGLASAVPADDDDAGEAAPADDTGEFSPEEEDAAAADAPAANSHGSLKRFNLKKITQKAEKVHGRGAVYLFDALSVLSRVPAYDNELRGLALAEVRDELIADLDVLGGEVPGTFCVVFDEPYEPGVPYGMEIQIEFASGGGQQACQERLEALADDYSGKLRTVCVVTGDAELGDRLREKGMHLMTLGEFFNA